MATRVAELVIDVNAEVSKAISALGNVSTAFNKTGNEATQNADKAGGAFGSGFSSKIDGAKGAVHGLIDSLGKVGLAAEGLKTITGVASGFVEGVNSSQKSLGTLEAKLGVTREEAMKLRGVSQTVFKQGWGESIDEVNQALVTTKGQFKNLNEAELGDLTQSALILKDTFEVDISQSVRTASTLTKNFGIDGTQAIDLMTVAFQKGGDKSEDLLDTFNEYSVQFRDMGFSAEEFTSVLVNGLEHGAFNTDKVADAVKEFNIRIHDGSKTSADALNALGINADEFTKKLASGAISGKDAMKMVNEKLQGTEDLVKRNQLGVALYGTQWEDMGMDVILNLDKGNIAIEKVEGATKKAGDALSNNFSAAWTSFSREALGALEPVASKVLDFAMDNLPTLQAILGDVGKVLKDVFEFAWPIIQQIADYVGTTLVPNFMKFADTVITAVKPFLADLGDFITGTLIPGLMNFGDFVTTVILPALGDIGTWIGNNVLPVLRDMGNTVQTVIIPALTTFGEYIVTTVIPKLGELAQWIGANILPLLGQLGDFIGGTVIPIIGTLAGFIGGTLIPMLVNWWSIIATVLKPIFEALIGFITGVAIPALQAIGNFIMTTVVPAFTTVANFVQANVMPVLQTLANFLSGALTTAFQFISNTANTVWNAISGFIQASWNTIQGIWNGLIGFINGPLTSAFNAIRDTISNVWNAISGFIRDAWSNIQGTWNNVTSYLSGTFTSAFNTIKSTIETVWNGIKTAISDAWNNIKGTWDNLTSFITGTLSSTFNDLKTTISNVWDNIKSGISNAIDSIVTKGGDIINFFKELPGNITNSIAGLADDLLSAGKKIVQGFVNGLTSIKIQLPHINVSWSSTAVGPVEIPIPNFSVSWYARGGIFNQPQMIGVGDAGEGEAVVPISKLQGYIVEAMQSVVLPNTGNVPRETSSTRRIELVHTVILEGNTVDNEILVPIIKTVVQDSINQLSDDILLERSIQ